VKAVVKIANAFEWGSKPPELPLSLGFCHPTGEGLSHGDKQHAQNIW